MKKNNFDSSITKLATVSQAQERYKLSRNSLIKFANTHNSIVKIGRSVRIDCEKLDSIISNGGN